MITRKVIYLSRGQIDTYKGHACCLDVTVKSSVGLGKHFAPTWQMVMAHKHGEMTNEQYTWEYTVILERLTNKQILELYDWVQDNFNGDSLTFLCYCPDGKFCHTYLLIDWLCREHPLLFCDRR